MSFTTRDAENTIAQWLTAVTGCPFYYFDANVARPNGLYGDVKFMTSMGDGTPIEQSTPETINGAPWIKHELNTCIVGVFSVKTYRTGARDVLATLENGQWLNTPYEILTLANIGLVRMTTAQDITETIEAAREERMQTDITFNLIGYAAEDINTITTVTLENLSAGITSEVSV